MVWALVVGISWRGLGISSGPSLGVLSALGVPSVKITSSIPILEAILEAFWVSKSAYGASVLACVGPKTSETVLNAKITKKRVKKWAAWGAILGALFVFFFVILFDIVLEAILASILDRFGVDF